MARSTLSRFFVLPIKGALGPSHQCYALSGHFLESGLGLFLGSEKVKGHPHTLPPGQACLSGHQRWPSVLVLKSFFQLKRNEILIHAQTWMNLENIILSEIIQTQEDKYMSALI